MNFILLFPILIYWIKMKFFKLWLSGVGVYISDYIFKYIKLFFWKESLPLNKIKILKELNPIKTKIKDNFNLFFYFKFKYKYFF
jgi:hypothetical protein